jgi:soluble lytic murein transglycosylase-like protein
VIDATLRGSLILLAAFAALRFMRHRSAAERELVLRCAILAMLVLSAIAATAETSLLWLAGVAVMVVRLALSARAVYGIRSREVRRVGRVSIRVGDVPTPMTWGVLRPVIILPEPAERRLPAGRYAAFQAAVPRETRAGRMPAERPAGSRRSAAYDKAVLRHELAHVRRGDALVLALAEVTKALQWFNPLVWLAVKRLRAESERACDDAVVASGIAPAEVADRLVRAGVGRRVLALLDPRVRRGVPSPIAVGAAVALACVSVAVAMPRMADRYAGKYGIPTQLARTIIDAAQAEGVDVDLAFGLVKAESNFRADAVSAAGAIGLTQILPSTARKLDPTVTRDDLFASCTNLRLGLRYLRAQMDAYDRDTALVAYNLGTRRVRELRASGKPLPMQYARLVLGSIQ